MSSCSTNSTRTRRHCWRTASIARYGIDMNHLGDLLDGPPQRQVLELFEG